MITLCIFLIIVLNKIYSLNSQLEISILVTKLIYEYLKLIFSFPAQVISIWGVEIVMMMEGISEISTISIVEGVVNHTVEE